MYRADDHALRHPAQTNYHQHQQGDTKGSNTVAVGALLYADFGQRTLDFEKAKGLDVCLMDMTACCVTGRFVFDFCCYTENFYATVVFKNFSAVVVENKFVTVDVDVIIMVGVDRINRFSNFLLGGGKMDQSVVADKADPFNFFMGTDFSHNLIDALPIIFQHLKMSCVQNNFTDRLNIILGIV
ncbi:MAG: hypothetical protein P1P74_06355 [Desulfuromonadales bacterium]|nr:hypothetical protein [Desulfuromonadales bacterium]